MHPEAMSWVSRWATNDEPLCILDVGGRDINGSPAPLFHEDSCWDVVDLHPAPNVTWVGDFLDYGSVDPFDVALYLEVAEHTNEWPEHIEHARNLLDHRAGLFVFTAAGPKRAAHSAIDGGPLRGDEWYQNIDPDRLADWLDHCFSRYVVDMTDDGTDVRAVAWR